MITRLRLFVFVFILLIYAGSVFALANDWEKLLWLTYLGVAVVVFFAAYSVVKWFRGAGERKTRLYLVSKAIKEFKPAQKYTNELPYQAELCGWLKSKFPNTKIEIRRGSSRPDIVVDNKLAIEVKGPTGVQDLVSIADKLMRYSQHFKELIVVLFDVQVYARRYTEWKSALDKHHPEVHVIRKD